MDVVDLNPWPLSYMIIDRIICTGWMAGHPSPVANDR